MEISRLIAAFEEADSGAENTSATSSVHLPETYKESLEKTAEQLKGITETPEEIRRRLRSTVGLSSRATPPQSYIPTNQESLRSLRETQEPIREITDQRKEIERIRDNLKQAREFADSVNRRADPQPTQKWELPAPGSLYNVMRAVGEAGYRMSLALSAAPEKKEGLFKPATAVQKESEAIRLPAMARFRSDLERWVEHLRWLKRPLGIWWVLLAVVAFTYGGGLAAMFADQYIIAIGLLSVTFAALAIRAVSEARDREKNILIVFLAVLFLAAHVGWVMYTHKQLNTTKSVRQLAEPNAVKAVERKPEPEPSVAPTTLPSPTPVKKTTNTPTKSIKESRRQQAIRDLHSQEP